MFIRRVTHTNKKNNTQYYTHKLVESTRTQRGPRQRAILNLGTDFELPQEQWKELANRIEEIITGQLCLLEYPKEIESLAIKYARKIICRGTPFLSTREVISKDYTPDYQMVDINSIEDEEVRSIGAEHVVYHILKELELDTKLMELGFTNPQKEVGIGVIAGRLISPGSERKTHIWLQEISGIDELQDTDFSMLSQDRVYQVSDMLLKYKEELEKHLSWKECNLFSLEEKIILYDLTNTFFEGSGKYNSKAKFGHSKERRSDCPLVTLGLVIDGDGFAKRSKVFNGNVSEPKTLKEMIRELSSFNLSKKPIVVMDAGIATEDNICWLKENGYDYIVVSRKKAKEIPEGIKMVTVKEGKDKEPIVQVGLVKAEDSEEFEAYCHSTSKEKKEEGIKSLFTQRFEEELKKVHEALSTKGGTKRYEKVIERVGRLKERYKKVACRYEIAIKKDADTNKATFIQWQEKDIDNASGVYCLRLNRDDLKEKEIWDIYTMLTGVEAAFRCMKSELGMRPVHHQKENRVDGHLFITVIAYHILQAIRFKLKSKGIHYSWETIVELLSTQVRITTSMKTKNGKMIHVRKSSKAKPFHKEIYDALNLPYQPGKTIKTIL